MTGNTGTGSKAGSVIGIPSRGRSAIRAVGRRRRRGPASSPSQSGPSSCEHRSSIAQACRRSCRRRSYECPPAPGASSRAGARRAARPRSPPRRQLVEDEVADRRAHSSGSGVPFALCSASFNTPRPRMAHEPYRVSGIPSSSAAPPSASRRPPAQYAPSRGREHRGGGLADRAATPVEADLLDHVAVREPDRDATSSPSGFCPRPARPRGRAARGSAGSCSGRG